MEVALHGATAVNGDFVRHDLAEAVNHCAASFVVSAAGINNGAADIACDPDLVDLDFATRVNLHFHDFRKIAAMGKLEGHAHAGVLGELVLALAPAGFFRDQL